MSLTSPPGSSTDASSYSSSTRSSSVTSSSNNRSVSSDNSSTSSEEEGRNRRTVPHSVPSRRVAASSAAASVSSTNTASAQLSGVRSVKLNTELVFEQPDSNWIDVPPGAGSVFRHTVTNYDSFPEGQYRVIDYFRTAVEMFITQLQQEYTHQYQQAQKNNRPAFRFTWRNKGELAICFAACCDMLKLLYDRFRPGPNKPPWEGVVNQFILLLMTESRISPSVLSEQTYNTKFLDWRKGGTRYQGDQLTVNVRFPSAEERRNKIETYLRYGVGYNIESTVLDAPVVSRPSATTVSTSDATVVRQVAQGSNAVDGGSAPVPSFIGFPRGQAPVKIQPKMQMKAPPALIAGKQSVDEYRHLQWLAKLAQITGGSPTLEFPEERSHMILAFVRFCETSEMPDHFITIMNILVKSGAVIQNAFERGGGMLVLRRFLGTLIRLKDVGGLINLVEQILRMKLLSWGHSSQQSWLRDLMGNSGNDLRWLRALEVIPADKQAVWSALLSELEKKYVLSASREEELQRGSKRTRLDMEEALRTSIADNVGVNKLTPCISTALSLTLPVEFRAPPLSSNIEQDTISLLNKKLQFCEEAQAAWRERIVKALDGKHAGVSIPVWYDPYQLLGVDPYPAS